MIATMPTPPLVDDDRAAVALGCGSTHHYYTSIISYRAIGVYALRMEQVFVIDIHHTIITHFSIT